jgi:hypothetical protein
MLIRIATSGRPRLQAEDRRRGFAATRTPISEGEDISFAPAWPARIWTVVVLFDIVNGF